MITGYDLSILVLYTCCRKKAVLQNQPKVQFCIGSNVGTMSLHDEAK